MKYLREFLKSTVVGGVLVLLPLWLTLLLLLKAFRIVVILLQPLASMLPYSAPRLLAAAVLLLACALTGLVVRTARGRAWREHLEKSIFGKLPGYTLFRGLTHKLFGDVDDIVWKPALVELDRGLSPAFIVEKCAKDRYTVFVPSAPTPMVGSIHVLDAVRVHPVQMPFTQAVTCVSHWGSGVQAMVAAMAGEQLAKHGPLPRRPRMAPPGGLAPWKRPSPGLGNGVWPSLSNTPERQFTHRSGASGRWSPAPPRIRPVPTDRTQAAHGLSQR